MTEQTQNAQPEQKPEDAPSKPTLEQLYDEYDVGQEAQANTVTHKPETRPGDTADTAIRDEVASLRQRLDADEHRRAEQRNEADLKTAIATLGKEAGIEGKDNLLRGYLIARASEDQRLRALWENRDQAPGAWKKALKILSDDVREEFEVPNPQLEENQRAMDESQRAHSTTSPGQPKPEDRVMQMGEAEFSQFWGRLAGRG